jgi:putative CocE/NonD family hydrolase
MQHGGQASLEQASVAPYEQVWIPMPDGAVFAGRLWLPQEMGEYKVPVVLEWIPYRQSDLTAVGDSLLHGWFAQHGVAALRVDLRGSGNSDGTLSDEYTAQEQDDAVAAIAWAAAQPWCNGAVGMIGISWSGFAALQVAARRPPALKAIITCCSTDNRYTDDVHFMGGCLLNDGLQWGTGFFNQIARPPDPAEVGPRWREMWQERLAALEPPLATWLAHREYDAYWKHGSVCENYAAIACPVYAVGGWTDGYSDAVLRLMANLHVPRKALIGPWTHVYPTWGTPGPKVGFLQECLRWWRHWLLGEETGIMEEPMVRLWMGEQLQPDPKGPAVGGEWFTLPAWPVEAVAKKLFLCPQDRALTADSPAADSEEPIAIDTPQHCGLFAGEWCPLDGGGEAPEFQADQRQDDALSVCFDGAVLEQPLEVAGIPVMELDLSLDGKATTLAIRLCEIAPDGTSARITFGLRRVARPPDCAPGEPFHVIFSLKGVAYRFSPGCRVRVAVSSAYWPMAWPEPVTAGLKLWPAGAVLMLPGMPASARYHPPPFEPPQAALPIPHEVLDPGSNSRSIVWDAATGKADLVIHSRRRSTRLGDLSFGGTSEETASILPGDPASARVVMRRAQFMQRPGWCIRLASATEFSWHNGGLRMNTTFEAFEDNMSVCRKTWDYDFPW